MVTWQGEKSSGVHMATRAPWSHWTPPVALEGRGRGWPVPAAVARRGRGGAAPPPQSPNRVTGGAARVSLRAEKCVPNSEDRSRPPLTRAAPARRDPGLRQSHFGNPGPGRPGPSPALTARPGPRDVRAEAGAGRSGLRICARRPPPAEACTWTHLKLRSLGKSGLPHWQTPGPSAEETLADGFSPEAHLCPVQGPSHFGMLKTCRSWDPAHPIMTYGGLWLKAIGTASWEAKYTSPESYQGFHRPGEASTRKLRSSTLTAALRANTTDTLFPPLTHYQGSPVTLTFQALCLSNSPSPTSQVTFVPPPPLLTPESRLSASGLH
ncbi:uncharacterized protein LOC123623401 [Lemur catta]|uniref:uncharacterized protein LOC123623401 n=1 Tax=Lemur catta TaxID=9447 RepID=UPI001E2671ED|nr:uncharacterized protein LOC123623401 [Lemur catta]